MHKESGSSAVVEKKYQGRTNYIRTINSRGEASPPPAVPLSGVLKSERKENGVAFLTADRTRDASQVGRVLVFQRQVKTLAQNTTTIPF